MKFNKIGIILFTSVLLLASCAKKSIAGIYGFQMGKEKGTHFGLFLQLTDKYITLDSQPEETKKYKEGEFSFSYKSGETPEGEEGEEDSFDVMTFLGKLFKQEGDIIKVPCYYYKGEKIPNTDQTELKIGVDFSFLQDVVDETTKDDDSVFPVLEPELIEMIVYTTYGNDVVTMNIPVAQEDAIFQLYWYGFDIYMDGTEVKINYDLEGHDPGTHPTEDDVAEINKTYGDQHKAIGEMFGIDLSTYRDFYTLAMGLVKQ